MTTRHGFIRTKERTGYKGDRAYRYIERALMNGKTSDECQGELRNYLESKSNADAVAIAYEGYCFIVRTDNVLITMYQLPKPVLQKAVYVGKERIQNFKKYMHLNKQTFFASDYEELFEEAI